MELAPLARIALPTLAMICAAPSIHALQAEQGFGSCVAALDDVDRDGVADFALALRPSDAEPERVLDRIWIVSAATGRALHTLVRPSVKFGRVLVNAGDVNGDGCADVAIAGTELTWVHSGRDGALLHELASPYPGAGIVRSIAAGSDVDGDGRSDVAVLHGGTELYRARITSGTVALHSGATGRVLRVLGAFDDSTFTSQATRSGFVRVETDPLTGAIAFCSDRNEDGRAELALGMRWSGWFGRGERHGLRIVDPLSGKTLQRLRTDQRHELPVWNLKELADLDGDGVHELAVAIYGRDLSIVSGARGKELHHHGRMGFYPRGEGTSLESIRDLDGDGVPDYLWAANEGGVVCDPGFVARYSGRTGESLGFFDLHDEKQAPFCRGADACAIGDVDGDRVPDLVIAIPEIDQVRVLSGKDGRELRRNRLSDPGSPALEVATPSSSD